MGNHDSYSDLLECRNKRLVPCRSMKSSLRSSMRLMHCTIKEVAQKEEKKGHLTSEDNGQPNFKGRMMADPLIIGPVFFLVGKVSRLGQVVNDGWGKSGIKL